MKRVMLGLFYLIATVLLVSWANHRPTPTPVEIDYDPCLPWQGNCGQGYTT